MWADREIEFDGYLLSSKKERLQLDVIHRYLSEESYWVPGISKETVSTCIANSFCFGVYQGEKQIGFARLVTDYAIFAHLADVFILPEYRGKGLSKAMMRFMLDFPEIQHIRGIQLQTRDAHGLYAQFGFGPHPEPFRYMVKRFKTYKNG